MLNLGILFITPLIGIIFVLFCLKQNTHESKDNFSRRVFITALVFAALNFIFSLLFVYNFDFSKSQAIQFEHDRWIMLKGFYLYSVGVDGFSLIMVCLTNFLMLPCLISAKSSITERPVSYASLFLGLQAFCIGFFIVKGIIWFYIFFEATLIPMFFIIGIWGGKARIYAAYKFFIYTFFGSVFFLLGIIYVVSITGETDMYLIAHLLKEGGLPLNTEKWLWGAFFISLAIKLPMFPFHTWLPDAHVQAPTSGSVLLAGILIKMGGYGMIRFLLPFFPSASLFFSDLVIILSVIAIIYGAIIAIMQEDIKKMIAYSSISHMGFVTAGIFSLTSNGITGAIFQMFSHGLISSGLFLSIGVLYERLHTRNFKDFGGIAKKMPKFAICLMVLTMSSAGLPATSGFIGEFITIISLYGKSFYYSLGTAFSVIFGALYILYMYKNTMFGIPNNTEINLLKDINKEEMFSLYSICFLVIIFGIYPNLIIQLINS